MTGNYEGYNSFLNNLISSISELIKFKDNQFLVSVIIFITINLLTTFARIYNLRLRFNTPA